MGQPLVEKTFVGQRCNCRQRHGERRVVVTGGPGAGKTALLELARRQLCDHVRVLPEAASVLFGGGFPREATVGSRKAAQRAIFHVQRQLEALCGPDGPPAFTVCDRGTLDGMAYWPGPPGELLDEVGTTREAEQARYALVIHMRTPSVGHGYNHDNALRTESAQAAAEIDRGIELAWQGHPRRVVVASRPDFLAKASEALAHLIAELPSCCRGSARD